MITSRSRAVSCLSAALAIAGAATADFITPDEYGWSRRTAGSAYFEWDVFTSAAGPNFPDVGRFPDPIPAGWEPDVFDISGGSFVTSTGNIYSFSTALNMFVVVPNYAAGPSSSTRFLLQVRTIGTEILPGSVRIDDFPPIQPVETRELQRIPLGPFDQVDTLYVFDVEGNQAEYYLRFEAAGTDMSLQRIAVDTLAAEGGCGCVCGYDTSTGGDVCDFFDFITFQDLFAAGDPCGCELDTSTGAGACDFFDFIAFQDAFAIGC